MNRHKGRMTAAFLTIAVMMLTACSGVPTSSAPQTVKAIGFGGLANEVTGPPKGATPQQIVDGFLAVNWAAALASARQFLAPTARKAWVPTTKSATVISASFNTGTLTSKNTLTVLAHALGTLNPDGAYTPSSGEVNFTFTLKSVGGEYRISSPPPGLVISEDLFNRYYFGRAIYFYDAAGKYLVPYVRYSTLVDPSQLANWSMNQLVNPPEPQNAVSVEILPAQAHRLTVSLGSLTKIEIAGSRQLEGAARNAWAAQVSQTLGAAGVTRGSLSIVDGTVPVQIPAVHGTVFSSSDFVGALGPPGPTVPEVNYLVGGRVTDQSGKALSGAINDGRYSYRSIALARRASTPGLAAAAVVGVDGREQLLVGSTQNGVRATSVPRGSLSRPAWAPGLDEVWIGDGAEVFRVDTSARTPVVKQVATPSAAGGGRVVALRLSPDGARIAMVISGSHRSGQLYVGSVVRGAGEPQVVNLQAISPDGVVITDVAWNYALRLTAIGYLVSSGEPRVFEVGVDGAQFDQRGTSGLPTAPTSLTATAGASQAWVSADGFVWIQSGTTSWISPGPTGQTPGTNPVYLS